MVFYGIRFDNSAQIAALEKELQSLQAKAHQGDSSNLHYLQQEINFANISSISLQTLVSIQYVARAISAYFQREYVAVARRELQPLRKEVGEWPQTATQFKEDLATKYTIRQRWITCLALGTGLGVRQLIKTPTNLPLMLGRTCLGLALSSLLLLPESSPAWVQTLSLAV